MMTSYYFVQPLDVLMIRGNKSFGDAGEHGEAIMPPWPSLFAGAFRSVLLADDAKRLAQFVAIGTDNTIGENIRCERMRALLGDALFASLGTPEEPGSFRITWVSLARQIGDGIDAVVPLPADLAAFDDKDVIKLVASHPASLPEGISTAAKLPMSALMRLPKQLKPEGGHWLDSSGFAQHVEGIEPASTLTTASLYGREIRLGIALDSKRGTAVDGALYTTEAVALTVGAGFLIGIEGAEDLLPESGLMRLGGDGKGARFQHVDNFELPALAVPEVGGRFRMILSTPGLFTKGWLPALVCERNDGSCWLTHEKFTARLACAAVSRNEVISGWDLANWQPKTAQRAAPVGSVYWFDRFEGNPNKLAEWVAGGLWEDNPDRQRRAEGFNNAWLAAWPVSD